MILFTSAASPSILAQFLLVLGTLHYGRFFDDIFLLLGIIFHILFKKRPYKVDIIIYFLYEGSWPSRLLAFHLLFPRVFYPDQRLLINNYGFSLVISSSSNLSASDCTTEGWAKSMNEG